MELPSVGDFDSIPSVIKTYTSMELNSVDDFDSLISDDTTNTSLETADVDYYDTLAKRITILEFPSDSELIYRAGLASNRQASISAKARGSCLDLARIKPRSFPEGPGLFV